MKTTTKGKHGRTVTIESFWEPCTGADGEVAYHACVIRWRDWGPEMIASFGEWAEESSTNISTKPQIRGRFLARNYGAHPLRVLDTHLQSIPAERLSHPPEVAAK